MKKLLQIVNDYVKLKIIMGMQWFRHCIRNIDSKQWVPLATLKNGKLNINADNDSELALAA